MSKKEFLICMIEHQDNSFINSLYIKAIALLEIKHKNMIKVGK